MISITQLKTLVQPLLQVFTRPSQVLFENLIEGWILCPCRRFVTSIFQFGDPEAKHAHDAYHRFFRAGAWGLSFFFKCLATSIVGLLGHPNVLWLLGDDTVHKKTGRNVDGAKYCRDESDLPPSEWFMLGAIRSFCSALKFVPLGAGNPWRCRSICACIGSGRIRRPVIRITGNSFVVSEFNC